MTECFMEKKERENVLNIEQKINLQTQERAKEPLVHIIKLRKNFRLGF